MLTTLHLSPDYFGDTDSERSIFGDAADEVEIIEHDGSTQDLVESPVSADVLITYGSPVDAALLDSVDPMVVAVYATGVDWVDVDAATERGIAVTRVPSYCDHEVGEHVISLALALCRGLPQYDASTAAGDWDWSVANPLRSFSELTFGSFAFGRKAQAATEMATAVGFECIAYDPYVDDATIGETGVEPVDYETLMTASDVLSLHAPLTDETRGVIDRTALEMLPDESILVNAGRGELVDEDALLWALEAGPLAGAGLDVLGTEPPVPDNPLLDRDDTIVTPHVAWNSESAIDRIRIRGTENAVAALRGARVDGVVNPEVFDSASFEPLL